VAGSAGVAEAATAAAGNDISYPQCGGAFPSNGAFGIVGVNGGRLYTANSCLGTGNGPSELSWAGMNAILYANTGDPGPALSSHWPDGQTSPQPCNTATNPGRDTTQCHYDYGWNGAADSYRDAVNAYVALGWAPVGSTTTPVANEWWLDVETANSWTSTTAFNVDALQGAADYLASVGASSVGFYSGSSSWQPITGNTNQFASQPSWVPGAGTLANAQSKCGGTGPSGGTVAYAQYASGGYDGDWRCGASPPPTGSMQVTVTKGSTVHSQNRFSVPLTATATDTTSAAPIAGGSATIQVASGTCSGPIVGSASGTTTSQGTFAYTFRTKKRGTFCALASVAAPGYANGSGTLTFSV